MAASYSITSKFQVTLPYSVRKNLHIGQHDKVEFVVHDGHVVIKKVPSLDDVQRRLQAKVAASGRGPATDEELDAARSEFMRKDLQW